MIRFVVWFLTCFFSTLGITYLYVKMNKIDFKLNFRILFVFFAGVLFATLLRYFQLDLLSSFSYFIYIPILFISLKLTFFRDLFFYVIIIWIIGMFLDIVSMLIVSLIYFLFHYDVIYDEIFKMLPTLLVFLMFIFIGHSARLVQIVNRLYDVYKKINYIDFSIISFGIFLLIFSIILAMNVKNLSVGFLLIFVMAITTLHFILLIKCKVSFIENSIFVNTLRENNEFYISMNAENNIFKHNLMAKMLSIKSVSNKKSRKLIDDFLLSFNNNIDFSRNIQQIPYGLNGIIYQKIYPYLSDLNVKINNQIMIDIFDVLTPRRYNVLVEKMVIALDNAIDSSRKSLLKLLVINLYSNGSEIILEIKNSFSGSLSVDDIGTLNYSTRGKKRGFGLFSSLREREASMNLKVINDLFVVTIIVKKK